MTSLGVSPLRRYVAVVAAGNLVWETLQLPLYRIWYHAHAFHLGVIVLAGTCGDIGIAIVSLICAFCLLGRDGVCHALSPSVTWATIAFGLAYTIASEAVHLRLGTWHYARAMPRLPILGVGVAPTLQWLIIPPIALRAAGGFLLSPNKKPNSARPITGEHQTRMPSRKIRRRS